MALAAVLALIGCAPKKTTCVGTCSDSTSCIDSCGVKRCPCAQGNVCDDRGSCVPCVVGSCARSTMACFDECGNADNACLDGCAQPDVCVDSCGVGNSAKCAGAECDPAHPGGCYDTCGGYEPKCCCTPTACANVKTCIDDCGNFNPSECKGRMCSGASCEDTCGEVDDDCWTSCAKPSACEDDCGRGNPNACSMVACDPTKSGFDSCGAPDDSC